MTGVALALGGGGALGWAHIGLLRVLEREGIRVDAVSGCSMGAIVAAALAAGKLDQLEAFARAVRRRTIFGHLDPGYRRGGLIGGRAVRSTLTRALGEGRLEELGLPIALVAADALTGAVVTLSQGDALSAIAASMAIPGVFPPVRIEGRLLVDGGVADPVPVSAARALSTRPVLAVNVLGDIRRRGLTMHMEEGRRATGPALAAQGIALVLNRMTRLSLAADPPDVLVEPAVGAFSPWAFDEAEALIAIGASAAENALEDIRLVAGR